MPASTARRGALALLLAALIRFVLGSIEIARGASHELAMRAEQPPNAALLAGILLVGAAGLTVIARRRTRA
jgi:hypothetical protein